MFAKLSTLAVVLPLVSAFTLNTPTGVTTGGLVTFTWTASTTDAPFFSLELANTIFHNTFAVANNIQTSLGTLTITLPQCPPGDGYTVEAIATNNVNQVYAQSGDFVVGAATTPTSSMASTSSASSVSSASVSSGTATTPAATVTAPTTAIPLTSDVTSSASATPSSFSNGNGNGAASFKIASGAAPAAAMVLAAVVGAAVVF